MAQEFRWSNGLSCSTLSVEARDLVLQHRLYLPLIDPRMVAPDQDCQADPYNGTLDRVNIEAPLSLPGLTLDRQTDSPSSSCRYPASHCSAFA